MKLVTIICEAFARDALTRLLQEVGAGAKGQRSDDIREFGNIQVEVVVPPDVAAQLLDRLAAEFFPRYAMIAFESDIRVLRPQKF